MFVRMLENTKIKNLQVLLEAYDSTDPKNQETFDKLQVIRGRFKAILSQLSLSGYFLKQEDSPGKKYDF